MSSRFSNKNSSSYTNLSSSSRSRPMVISAPAVVGIAMAIAFSYAYLSGDDDFFSQNNKKSKSSDDAQSALNEKALKATNAWNSLITSGAVKLSKQPSVGVLDFKNGHLGLGLKSGVASDVVLEVAASAVIGASPELLVALDDVPKAVIANIAATYYCRSDGKAKNKKKKNSEDGENSSDDDENNESKSEILNDGTENINENYKEKSPTDEFIDQTLALLPSLSHPSKNGATLIIKDNRVADTNEILKVLRKMSDGTLMQKLEEEEKEQEKKLNDESSSDETKKDKKKDSAKNKKDSAKKSSKKSNELINIYSLKNFAGGITNSGRCEDLTIEHVRWAYLLYHSRSFEIVGEKGTGATKHRVFFPALATMRPNLNGNVGFKLASLADEDVNNVKKDSSKSTTSKKQDSEKGIPDTDTDPLADGIAAVENLRTDLDFVGFSNSLVNDAAGFLKELRDIKKKNSSNSEGDKEEESSDKKDSKKKKKKSEKDEHSSTEAPSTKILSLYSSHNARYSDNIAFAKKQKNRFFKMALKNDLILQPGGELFFTDEKLTDASALCYQGVWFTRKHRMYLSLNLPESVNNFNKDIAKKHCQYDAKSHSFSLFITGAHDSGGRKKDAKNNNLSHQTLSYREEVLYLMGCFRFFNFDKKIPSKKYFKNFPLSSTPIDQASEYKVAKMAAEILQQRLDVLISSNKIIRQKFGADFVAKRPSSKVREAETIMLVQLLKIT